MRIPRIFVDTPLTANQNVVLPAKQSHYIVTVLRLQPGRPLILFNGQGGQFSCVLESANKKGATIVVSDHKKEDLESPLRTELAIGVSKGDRMDWIVQKATELGVTTITPLLTSRSEVKLNPERWRKKITHWQDVAISACEQSGRNRLPVINDTQIFQSFLDTCNAELKLLMHPCDQNTAYKNNNSNCKNIALIVGPEGGFSDEEIAAARAEKCELWSLGPRILRTETAPVVALGILQEKFGDF